MSTLMELSETLATRPIATACRAVVIVPARNEEEGLAATLDALRQQRTLAGEALPHDTYEVLLLLNNCTDRSAHVAAMYAERWPTFILHVAETILSAGHAHVGTARRLLMEEACARLESLAEKTSCLALLSTDADTLVAPDWIAANLAALEAGAEVVGGVISLFAQDYAALPPCLQRAYQNDREYQAAVAELESLLDPDASDPWPRHLEHFGASLACTPEVYRRCGGLPAVKPLEDVAFIAALRRIGARIRHSPAVHISTSARLDGRAEIGLSGQLRHWQDECARNLPHTVESASWLAHRFRTLGQLRVVCRAGTSCYPDEYPAAWEERIDDLQLQNLPAHIFLERLDCDRLIAETFVGNRHQEIADCIAHLQAHIAQLKAQRATL